MFDLLSKEMPPTDRDDRARVLAEGMLLVTAGLVVFGAVQLLLTGNWVRFSPNAAPLAVTMPVVALISLYLNRRGATALAGWLFVASYIALAAWRAPHSGGVRAPSVILFPIMAMFAGIAIDAWAGLLTAIVCLAVGVGLVILEQAGVFPQRPVSYPPMVYWASLVLNTTVSLFLLRIALRRVARALQSARDELKARAIAERKLDVALDACAIGAFEAEIDAEVIKADERVFKLLGFPLNADQTVSRAEIRERMSETGLEAFLGAFSELERGADRCRIEFEYRHPDGTPRHFDSSVSIYVDPATGKRVQVGTIWDVTERKAALQAVAESEARYRLLAENSTDLVLTLDLTGALQYVSPSVRMLGYAGGHDLGLNYLDFLHPEDGVLSAQRAEALLQGETVAPLEVRVRHADGHWVWMESNPAALRDDSGRIIGMITNLRGISERKAAEAALQEVSAEFTRVARISTLGAFAASITHETNQPLAAAAIDGELAQRWLEGPEPNLDKARQVLRRASANILRASSIISGLRAMVVREESIRAGFDLAEVLREVMPLVRTQSHQAGAVIVWELEPVSIVGDRIQIQQVALNLVANAIDAVRDLDDDRRTILVRSGPGEAGAVLSVEDQGDGVPPQNRDRIFDSMFTTKKGGTGLGLAICKSIADAHGGTIAMETLKPHGSIFRVDLPSVDGESQADARATRLGSVTG